MQKNSLNSDDIIISIETAYLANQSDPETNRFVFSYTITILNMSSIEVQLLSRHWLIKDANYKLEEVIGEGVVGEQPILKPNEGFQYTSGAVLETDVGTMGGFYHFQFRNDDNEKEMIKIPIPEFVLSIPRKLH